VLKLAAEVKSNLQAKGHAEAKEFEIVISDVRNRETSL